MTVPDGPLLSVDADVSVVAHVSVDTDEKPYPSVADATTHLCAHFLLLYWGNDKIMVFVAVGCGG